MKNKFVSVILSIMLMSASTSAYPHTGAAAAGGISAGTAIAIGVVGAALLVALGDSSSSSPAARFGHTRPSSPGSPETADVMA